MIRTVTDTDLPRIREFITRCEPLGFHTLFTYWVLGSHFTDLFLICEEGSRIQGLITGLVSSTCDNTAFVWQLGVSPESRRQGVAQSLISEFCSRASKLGAGHIQVTIEPDNLASLGAFTKYAQSIGRELRRIDTLELNDEYASTPIHEIVYSLDINQGTASQIAR